MNQKKSEELSYFVPAYQSVITIVQLVNLRPVIYLFYLTTFSFPCAEALSGKRAERLWGRVTSMYI